LRDEASSSDRDGGGARARIVTALALARETRSTIVSAPRATLTTARRMRRASF
jgi:hypothetical protein